MKRTIIILISIIFIGKTYSQTDFRKGYYINHANDTIYGLLDYRGDIRNAKVCKFKKDSLSEPIKFKPEDINAYRFIDSKFYISKKVKINEDEEKQIFLEYLLNGVNDLFYYKDRNDIHYLIETRGGRLLELTNDEVTFYVDGIEYKRKNNKYIGLLKAIFSDCMEMQSEVDKVKLNHKSLINITKKYHDYACDGEKCIIYEKKPPLFKISFAPLVGFSLSQLNFKPNNAYSGFNFDNNNYPSIGFFLNTSLGSYEKLSFLSGTIFSKHIYNYYNDNGNSKIDFGIYTYYLKVPVALKYTYPKHKYRPYINVGYFNTFVLRTKYQFIKTEVKSDKVFITNKKDIYTDKFQLSVFVGMGLQYNLKNKKSFFIEAQYEYGKNILNGSITNISIITGIIF